MHMSEDEDVERIERTSSFLEDDVENSLDKINFSNSKFEPKRYPMRLKNLTDDEPLPLNLDRNDGLLSPYSMTSGKYSKSFPSFSEPIEECAID
jgi:hypothetical protein